jgi:hypothetical protein
MPKITSIPVGVPLGSVSYGPSVEAYVQRELTDRGDGASRQITNAYRRDEVANTMQGPSRRPVSDVRGRYLPVSPRSAAGWRTSAKGERTKAWVESLGGGPQIGRSDAIEGSSTIPQENANPALVGDHMEEEGGGEQSALAEGLPSARYDTSIRRIRMQGSGETPTFNVASTVPAASMYNRNNTASRATVRPPKPQKHIGPAASRGVPVGQHALVNNQQRYLPGSGTAVKSKKSILVVNFMILTLYTR